MTSPTPSDFLAQFVPDDVSPVQLALIQSRTDDLKAANQAEAEAAASQVRHEERDDRIALMDRAMGGPLAELSRARSSWAAANDEVTDLTEQLRKAEHKRDIAADNMQFWGERHALVMNQESEASRSTDPFVQAHARAQAALEAKVQDAAREGQAVLDRARANVASRRGLSRLSRRSASLPKGEPCRCEPCAERGDTRTAAEHGYGEPHYASWSDETAQPAQRASGARHVSYRGGMTA